MNVAEIMSPKVFTITQDQPVSEAASMMRKHNVGGLVVLDPERRLAGIVTSRDLRGVPGSCMISQIMSRQLTVAEPDTSVWEALEIIRNAKVERLPVVAGEKLIGIVTKTDLLIAIARHTDSLTGMYTAAYLRDVARRLLYTAKEICIIFADIDNFGFINKQFGHAEGDQCLRILAKLLQKHSKQGQDFPCRFAGDEFAVVSLRSLSQALNWASDFKHAVENACYTIPLTVSIGIAGGQRRKPRGTNAADVVESLINLASLASTNAKETSSGVKIADAQTQLLN